MGVMRADGDVLINPPMDTRFARGDQVIAITEDDDTLVLSANVRRRPAGRQRAVASRAPAAARRNAS